MSLDVLSDQIIKTRYDYSDEFLEKLFNDSEIGNYLKDITSIRSIVSLLDTIVKKYFKERKGYESKFYKSAQDFLNTPHDIFSIHHFKRRIITRTKIIKIILQAIDNGVYDEIIQLKDKARMHLMEVAVVNALKYPIKSDLIIDSSYLLKGPIHHYTPLLLESYKNTPNDASEIALRRQIYANKTYWGMWYYIIMVYTLYEQYLVA